MGLYRKRHQRPLISRKTRLLGSLILALAVCVFCLKFLAPLEPSNNTSDDAFDFEGQSIDTSDWVEEASLMPGMHSTYSKLSLEETAKQYLQAKKDQKNSVILQSGFLDLLGNNWSCVISEGKVVSIFMLHRLKDGACETKLLQLDRDLWEREAKDLILDR